MKLIAKLETTKSGNVRATIPNAKGPVIHWAVEDAVARRFGVSPETLRRCATVCTGYNADGSCVVIYGLGR